MANTNVSTREAEALFMLGKYEEAITLFTRAIASIAPLLFEIELESPHALNLDEGISSELHKLLQDKGIDLPDRKDIVLSLSSEDEPGMWLITGENNQPEQGLLVIEGEGNTLNIHRPTVSCHRAFAHQGESYFQKSLAIYRRRGYSSPQEEIEHINTVALANLEFALKLSPNYAWAHAKKGEIHRIKGNRYDAKATREGHYDQAIASLEKAISLTDNNYAWALAHKGATICNARWADRYEEAMRNLTQANLLMGGEYAWAIAYQGAIHLQQAMDDEGEAAGQAYDQSIFDLMSAIILDNRVLEAATEPGERFRNLNLGFAYLCIKRQKFERAVSFCDQALMQVPKGSLDYARALYYRALSYKYWVKSLQDSPVSTGLNSQLIEGPYANAVNQAHSTLIKLTDDLLDPVKLDGDATLNEEEKEELKKLSERLRLEEKQTVEETCTMLLAVDALRPTSDPDRLQRIFFHLPRMIAIYKYLFDKPEIDQDRVVDWCEAQPPQVIFAIIDEVIWQEKHLDEAIREAMNAH